MWVEISSSAPQPLQGTINQPRYVEMSSQGAVSSKRASNHPRLRPVNGQLPGLSSRTGAGDQLSSLALSAGETPPHCCMQGFIFLLVICLETHKAGSGTTNCWEPIGNFISTYPKMSRDPLHSHYMPGRDTIQSLLALLYQWGLCFSSLKFFQSHLPVRANTNETSRLCRSLEFHKQRPR